MLAIPAAAYHRLQSSVGFGSAAWPTQWIGHRYQVWSKRNLGTHDLSAADDGVSPRNGSEAYPDPDPDDDHRYRDHRQVDGKPRREC